MLYNAYLVHVAMCVVYRLLYHIAHIAHTAWSWGEQRLQVVTGVRPAKPAEHPRLVAGFNRHHAFIPVRLRLWSAGHKRTASPACAGRAAALL